MKRLGRATICALVFSAQALAGPYEDGVAKFDRGDYAGAMSSWRPLADRGQPTAQLAIAVLYEQGLGTERDLTEAARWYLEAAQRGLVEAQYSIAVLYETGTGIAQDLDAARRWYNRALFTPRTDASAAATKERARQRLAKLGPIPQEVIPYEGGRYVVTGAPDGTCLVALQGSIGDDARWKFDDVVARAAKAGCSNRWLLLESPGGGLVDGVRLGHEVRAEKFRTITRFECASACALIFLGGIERVLGGSRAKLGWHQPASITGYAGHAARHCDSAVGAQSIGEIRKYVRSMVPAQADAVMDLIISTSCDDITWTEGRRALELGIATKLEAEGVDVFGSLRNGTAAPDARTSAPER